MMAALLISMCSLINFIFFALVDLIFDPQGHFENKVHMKITGYTVAGAYHSKESTTSNSVVVIAQNISADWRIEKLPY